VRFEVREVRTEGDRRTKTSLSSIGGQGVFVKELEAALLAGAIDLAVHSLKDVPTELAAGLTLAAFPPRANPQDALVSRDGATLATLPSGARIGTGSARRAVQLRAFRRDLRPVDIRGNVDTRIRKVDDGEVDAAVLAAAGLERLGLLERAAELVPLDAMMPAVGQGTLAIEARADDAETLDLVSGVDDRETRLASQAERAFLRRLGGGCRLPFGALATVEGDTMRVRGFVSDAEGGQTFRAELSGPAAGAESLGVQLAERMLEQGAGPLVETAQSE
jgi:hydroxymethylbilane synthase